MNQKDWYTRGLDAAWRHVVAQEIFHFACTVILEEASSVRTAPNSTEVNALQNQFREGIFSAIRSLRALATPLPEAPAQLHKPWERDKDSKPEELPPGPKRPES